MSPDRRSLSLCLLFLTVFPVGLTEAANEYEKRGVEVAESESREQSVNGYWSGLLDSLVPVLTRASSGGRWQVMCSVKISISMFASRCLPSRIIGPNWPAQ